VGLDRIKKLGEIRDVLLVSATLLYALGYFVWSLYAALHGWGLLPALEPQYVAAGIVPALLLVFAYLVWRVMRYITRRLADWLSPTVADWRIILRRILLLTAFISFLTLLLGTEIEFLSQFRVYAIIVLLLDIYFLPPIGSRSKCGESIFGWLENYLAERFWSHPRFLKFYRLYTTIVLVAGIGVVAVWAGVVVLPWLPVPFGLRPRRAYLELDRTSLSSATIETFTADPSKTLGAMRTVPVWILFSCNDFVLVYPPNRMNEVIQGEHLVERAYEVRKEAIKAIGWMDEAGLAE
jgi:hypothetical protein